MRGATRARASRWAWTNHFNPRTPCGVRHRQRKAFSQLRGFQSTHPMRGATTSELAYGSDIFISIHAPHAGCDTINQAQGAQEMDFNPRTPCGVRPDLTRSIGTQSVFQSTHPMRGATNQEIIKGQQEAFQSTHPMRGATKSGVVSHRK